MRTIDLKGKTALVTGVANQRSLAWSIAEALGGAGCRLAFTYQGERLKDNVSELVAKHRDAILMPCDVTHDIEIDAAFDRIEREFGRLDILIHSIAFARKEDLAGDFRKTSRAGWRTALDISAYSLVTLTNGAVRLMQDGGGAVVALTFQAGQKVFPHYNVMGSAKAALEHSVRQLAYELGPLNIRVNAVSAGPVPTLSARGVSGFSSMLSHHRKLAPLRRSVEPREVADAALFLCTDMASGITGSTVFVDAGYHIMGF